MSKSLKKLYFSEILGLMTPKNITYLWGFGSFLGTVMVFQIVSGFVLSWFYVSGSMGWASVYEITREVSLGWLIRLIHSNTASFVFLLIFIHFFRGLIQSSFSLKGPWISGWLIMVLTMMSAFLGYVLPWGQMSFWGATVIINLLSVLPKGKVLVTWLWSGFYVSAFTCSFFYSLHFITPFVVMVVSILHIFLLHFSGSSVFGGMSRAMSLKTKFSHLFSFKDLVNLGLVWFMWMWTLAAPDWASDPVNFSPSDMTNSPIHIQPEWYFLHLYAVLRSIPNKMGGLLGFALALVSLLMLSLLKSNFSLNQFYLLNFFSWSFIFSNFILMWLGSMPVEEPFVFMGQIMTTVYFIILYLFVKSDFILVLIMK